jgi:exonuclease SbcD
MKILHTADWHIGKRLHKYDLLDDFRLFKEWLISYIKESEVEVVLVSGDIFDLATPSSEAQKAYFDMLLALRDLNCKVIMTGGNHDSPRVLNAPASLLEAMNIHVIGNLPEDLENVLVPLREKDGSLKAVIAAVPYLRESDLRTPSEDGGMNDKVEIIRKGIAEVFRQTAQVCEAQYPGIPAIAMGHLFAAGVSTSESEREIQIGNEASFEATGFGTYFNYIALGHIHRPQQVSGDVPTFYSGSPMPLSFSEKEDQKRILVLDTDTWEVGSIPIPSFRKLLKIKGSMNHLKIQLEAVEKEGALDTLVELELVEEQFDVVQIKELDQMVSDFSKEGVEVVKHRVSFRNTPKRMVQHFDGQTELEDLQPREVFEKLLGDRVAEEEKKNLIREAFIEILEEVYSAEEI